MRSTPDVPTLRGQIVLGIAMFGASQGVDLPHIEEALGRAVGDLADPDLRLPYPHALAVWRLLERELPDRPLGLELAAVVPPEVWGTYHFASRHAPTLSDAVDLWVRYHRVISSHAQVGREGATVCLAHVDAVQAVASVAEFGLGFSVRALREMAPAVTLLDRVDLPHRPRGDAAAYEAFFEAPVRFGCPVARLVFRPEALAGPARHGDPVLFEALQTALDGALADVRARYPDEADPVASTRRAIATLGEHGVWSSDAVAHHLGVPLRTLQRHLCDHGATLTDLLNEQRRTSAVRLLRGPPLSLDDVAFLCGYADERSFTRAFKRWTGRTPVAFRNG
ncbi:MAG: AraC family transcriptional regulator ligand-binding domain-containing protein [Alphaproteobacteria bacterium]|nr:AraC family transcriptional regulator ligand-binding domain-containing protein [Alphaproteobacteria bacterium]